MGRQPAAVWQFSQGIASGPCGLRVVSRCGVGPGALAADEEKSSSQHRI